MALWKLFASNFSFDYSIFSDFRHFHVIYRRNWKKYQIEHLSTLKRSEFCEEFIFNLHLPYTWSQFGVNHSFIDLGGWKFSEKIQKNWNFCRFPLIKRNKCVIISHSETPE